MATLEELARKKFAAPPLSAAEERVVRAAPEGTEADCSGLGGGSDPANPQAWPAARNVRADLIRWFCVDREARERIDPKGVRIQGARIAEDIDLSYTNLFPLFLTRCRLERELHLKYAEIPVLSLEGSWTGAVDADGFKLEGDIFLTNGFHAEGEVRLIGATIGGDLNAEGGTFTRALSADRVEVSGSVFLGSGFRAEVEVLLVGAAIGGDLDAEGGTFRNSSEEALNADRIKVTGTVFIGEGFDARGEVRLFGATIGGDLDATGGTFINSAGDALSGDLINVTGDVVLRKGFNAEGGVRLFGASIGGDLDAAGGSLKNSSGDALSGDGINVTGDVVLREGFSAEGEVRLPGATIGGDLDATGGTFRNFNGPALSADGINLAGDAFLGNGFSAEGEVRLIGATIEGSLDADGGRFKNTRGDALSADRIHVTGDVLLGEGFYAQGAVRLSGAEINGQLEVNGAQLDALDLYSAHVLGPFYWKNVQNSAPERSPRNERASLNLTDAKVGALADEEGSWADNGELLLDGFVYDQIADGPTDAPARLRWLRLQPHELVFRPQPYEQLIAALRRMGYEDQVAKVAIAKQWDQRKRGHLGVWGVFQNWFLYLVLGYWYRPWLAFVWIAVVVCLGTWVFSHAHSDGVMVPSVSEAYKPDEKTQKGPLPRYYPDFNPFMYSLEVTLPFDLGQKSNWRLIERSRGDRAFWVYEFWSLFQLLIGWALLLVAAAIWAGLIKRD